MIAAVILDAFLVAGVVKIQEEDLQHPLRTMAVLRIHAPAIVGSSRELYDRCGDPGCLPGCRCGVNPGRGSPTAVAHGGRAVCIMYAFHLRVLRPRPMRMRWYDLTARPRRNLWFGLWLLPNFVPKFFDCVCEMVPVPFVWSSHFFASEGGSHAPGHFHFRFLTDCSSLLNSGEDDYAGALLVS